MCTLIAAVGQFRDYPLVVAANRDEALERPSSGPRLWDAPIRFIAPRDEKAGGTWLGVNARGLFVGITNRFMGPRDPERASRGFVVTEALEHPDVESLHASMGKKDPRKVNAFHLLYADASGHAGVTWTDGEKLYQERLQPGLHVVTERNFGAADEGRVEVIRRTWPTLFHDGEPDIPKLKSLLAYHDEQDPFASVCIHAPEFNYGTRSSTVLLLEPTLTRSHLHATEGSPCTAPWSDLTALLSQLRAPAIK